MNNTEVDKNKRFTMTIVLVLFVIGIASTFLIRDIRNKELNDYLQSKATVISSSSSTVSKITVDKNDLQSKMKQVNDIFTQLDKATSDKVELEISL
jgi:hypothetical protein